MILLYNDKTAVSFFTRKETRAVGINTKKGRDFGNGQLVYNFYSKEEMDVYMHNICNFTGIHTDGHCWYRISRMSDTYAEIFRDAVKILENQDVELENPDEYEYTLVFRASNPNHLPFTETIKFQVSLLNIVSRDDLEDFDDDDDDDDDEDVEIVDMTGEIAEDDDEEFERNYNQLVSEIESMKTFVIEFDTFENMYRYCQVLGLSKTNVYRCQNRFCIEIPSGKKKDRTDNYDRYGMCACEYEGEIDDAERRAFVLEHGELASENWNPLAS